jgi:hypothetical protein
MVATPSQLPTVDDFRRLPEDDGSVYHELRHGELVPVTRPKFKHFRIQKQLEKLLEAAGGDRGVAAMELPFALCPSTDYGWRMWPMFPKSAGRQK